MSAEVAVDYGGKCWQCRRRTTGEALRQLAAAPVDRAAEAHYVYDPEDAEDESEYGATFAECTPARRLRACPVCEAPGDEPRLKRRWQVTHPCWDMWVVVDTAWEALDLAEAERCCELDYTVSPLWMLRDQEDRMPEWEP